MAVAVPTLHTTFAIRRLRRANPSNQQSANFLSVLALTTREKQVQEARFGSVWNGEVLCGEAELRGSSTEAPVLKLVSVGQQQRGGTWAGQCCWLVHPLHRSSGKLWIRLWAAAAPQAALPVLVVDSPSAHYLVSCCCAGRLPPTPQCLSKYSNFVVFLFFSTDKLCVLSSFLELEKQSWR